MAPNGRRASHAHNRATMVAPSVQHRSETLNRHPKKRRHLLQPTTTRQPQRGRRRQTSMSRLPRKRQHLPPPMTTRQRRRRRHRRQTLRTNRHARLRRNLPQIPRQNRPRSLLHLLKRKRLQSQRRRTTLRRRPNHSRPLLRQRQPIPASEIPNLRKLRKRSTRQLLPRQNSPRPRQLHLLSRIRKPQRQRRPRLDAMPMVRADGPMVRDLRAPARRQIRPRLVGAAVAVSLTLRRPPSKT